MDYEECEIRAIRHGSIWPVNHEFEAVAYGPRGRYVVAHTPEFGEFEPKWWRGFIPPSSGVDEPDNLPFQRRFLDALVDHLIETGWEPLAASGTSWYSRRFRRSLARHIPDPDPKRPYTIGDRERAYAKWKQAMDRAERHPSARHLRTLADSLMELGLALERTYAFDRAYISYSVAAEYYGRLEAVNESNMAQQGINRVEPRRQDDSSGSGSAVQQRADEVEQGKRSQESSDDPGAVADQMELKRGRAYIRDAIERARGGAGWELVNITFENARTCFRRISNLDIVHAELASSYTQQAEMLEQVYHEPAQAQAARDFAQRYRPRP